MEAAARAKALRQHLSRLFPEKQGGRVPGVKRENRSKAGSEAKGLLAPVGHCGPFLNFFSLAVREMGSHGGF